MYHVWIFSYYLLPEDTAGGGVKWSIVFWSLGLSLQNYGVSPQSVLRREREYTNTTHTLYRRCLSLHPSRDPWSVDRRWYINVNPSSGFPPYELRGHCEVTSVTPPPSAWHNVRQYGFESALLFLLYQGLYVGPHEEEEDTVRVNSLIANELLPYLLR